MKRFALSLLCLMGMGIVHGETRTIPFSDDLKDFLVEQMPGGRVTAEDGALVIQDVAGCTVWLREKFTAPVEISYEATVIMTDGPFDRLSDLNCFWMADTPQSPEGLLASTEKRTGRFADYDTLATYYVGYGGNYNSTTRFRRYDGTGARPLLPDHDLSDAEYLLKPNHTYHIRLVARDGRAEYWRDGQLVFAYDDPEPLTDGYFGFRTVKSHLVIRNLRITTGNTKRD